MHDVGIHRDTPILSVRNLSKRFGALAATDSVSLDLLRGDIHAVIGPNGAGKSTLIKQVCGELQPDAGQILFDGVDVARLAAPERARAGLGRTFQISTLALELTVLQNVMLAAIGQSQSAFRLYGRAMRDSALQDAAMAQLERVGIADLADRSAGILAHGQRRLLEVAIALALKPKALLLDEPMAGLGDAGSKELTTLLDALRHEVPILLVEHDMDAVFALADRITVLDYGRVLATGTVDEVRSNPDVREAYLGAVLT